MVLFKEGIKIRRILKPVLRRAESGFIQIIFRNNPNQIPC